MCEVKGDEAKRSYNSKEKKFFISCSENGYTDVKLSGGPWNEEHTVRVIPMWFCYPTVKKLSGIQGLFGAIKNRLSPPKVRALIIFKTETPDCHTMRSTPMEQRFTLRNFKRFCDEHQIDMENATTENLSGIVADLS